MLLLSWACVTCFWKSDAWKPSTVSANLIDDVRYLSSTPGVFRLTTAHRSFSNRLARISAAGCKNPAMSPSSHWKRSWIVSWALGPVAIFTDIGCNYALHIVNLVRMEIAFQQNWVNWSPRYHILVTYSTIYRNTCTCDSRNCWTCMSQTCSMHPLMYVQWAVKITYVSCS